MDSMIQGLSVVTMLAFYGFIVVIFTAVIMAGIDGWMKKNRIRFK